MYSRYGYGKFAFLLTKIPVSFSGTLWISKNIWDSHKYDNYIWKNAKRKEYEEIRVICVQLHKCLFNSAPTLYIKIDFIVAQRISAWRKAYFLSHYAVLRMTDIKHFSYTATRSYCTKQLSQLYNSIQNKVLYLKHSVRHSLGNVKKFWRDQVQSQYKRIDFLLNAEMCECFLSLIFFLFNSLAYHCGTCRHRWNRPLSCLWWWSPERPGWSSQWWDSYWKHSKNLQWEKCVKECDRVGGGGGEYS